MKFVWETPEEINLALAQRLSRIRKRRNLSQQALSKKSNVSFGSIKRFETSGQISLISLTKLCVALDCVEEIKKSRYDRWEWNYGASPEYGIVKKRRVEGVGSIELHADVKSGVLERLCFYGDFFGKEDPAALAERLKGVPMRYADVMACLRGTDVGAYFAGLSEEVLASIILD